MIQKAINTLGNVALVVERLGDVAQTSRDALRAFGAITSALDAAADHLSHAGGAAEMLRFGQFADSVRGDVQEAVLARVDFVRSMNIKRGGDERAIVGAFIDRMARPVGNAPVTSPQGSAYAVYAVKLLKLAADCAATADYLKQDFTGSDGFNAQDREKLHQAASRKLSELKAKSKGGKKGAKLAKAAGGGGKDKTRKAILDEAKRKLQEREDRGGTRSNNAIFSEVAARHTGLDGKPIMSAGAIKKALQRAKSEKRGKYARTGKPRGRYKAGTR